jgi:anti-sigma B factor antagonist
MNLSGKFLAGSDGPFLRQKVKDLIDAGTKQLVIDFSEVPYIDSTGLGFLAGSRVTAQDAGASIILASLNEHVKKILDGVQLSQFFVTAKDEEAALLKLKQMASPETPRRGRAAEPKRKKISPVSGC